MDSSTAIGQQRGSSRAQINFFWIKARQMDGVWVNSNAASATPNATSTFWPLTGNLGTHDPTLTEENGTWYEFQTGPGIYRKVSRNGGTN